MPPTYSRFRNTPMVVVDGHETYGVWNSFPWLKERPADDFVGTLVVNNQFEGRPDRLAMSLYGTPLLDWVLIAFNAKHNNDHRARTALRWPMAGQTIIYPRDSLILPSVVG